MSEKIDAHAHFQFINILFYIIRYTHTPIMSDLIEMDSEILSFEKNYDYSEIFGGMPMANTSANATRTQPPMDWVAIMEDEKNLKNNLNRVVPPLPPPPPSSIKPFVGLREINKRSYMLPQIRQQQHNFRYKIQQQTNNNNNNNNSDTPNNGRFCRGMKGNRKWFKPAQYLHLNEFIRFSNSIIFMVDIQTIGIQISEMTIYTPSMPVYNRHYKLVDIHNEDLRIKAHNIKYNGWSKHAQETGLNYTEENHDEIFANFRNCKDAVFIFRGDSKRKFLMNIVKKYQIEGLYFTFPEYFMNNNVCHLHDNSVASCSVANVQQMISYYTKDDKVLSHLFCTEIESN